jgi:hypothetical protein
MNEITCPICSKSSSTKDLQLQEFSTFLECVDCDFYFHKDRDTKKRADTAPHEYSDLYWSDELAAAKERAFGVSIARAAEVFVLSKVPIRKFLDIGTGPGYFLDAIQKFLPDSITSFFGVELFPPSPDDRTKHPGYRLGWLDQFADSSIDGGICIEVLEHLRASDVRDLFSLLYTKASSGAAFMFNTGLTDYVRSEDVPYLDPVVRGHISIWSVKALRELISDLGWTITPIPNRTWAFLAEKTTFVSSDFSSRIWETLPENMEALCGAENSKLLYLLGRDSLRAI